MECYLDNAATTRAKKEVCELVTSVMYDHYGNPSSLHGKGFEAEKIVKKASEQIAKTLKCTEKNIIFTSGGTESNNTALIATALANQRRGKHIITTCFEHASVHQPLIYLEKMGFEVTYLPVDHNGHVLMEALREALREDTILVSLMMVNNEVGSVLDVAEVSRCVKEFCPEIIFHVDAIQAYGKIKILPKKMGIDLMSVSGHKIHGPKGTGFLYQGDKVKMHPLIHGGGQQRGMRSGTENVPGIAGLGLAAQWMDENLEQHRSHLFEIKRYFVERLGEIPQATVNACDLSSLQNTAPHILSVSFEGVRSEVLLHALEEKEVYVSSGSACSSNHPGISGTLKAIGVDNKLLDSTIRFSFCPETTKEQIDYTMECLQALVPMLARYRRG
ncbi:MAG: cysteine desulfurase [Eubacterium sp.]|nr:cysteine desulfurase [Eubacterium sp.]